MPRTRLQTATDVPQPMRVVGWSADGRTGRARPLPVCGSSRREYGGRLNLARSLRSAESASSVRALLATTRWRDRDAPLWREGKGGPVGRRTRFHCRSVCMWRPGYEPRSRSISASKSRTLVSNSALVGLRTPVDRPGGAARMPGVAPGASLTRPTALASTMVAGSRPH